MSFTLLHYSDPHFGAYDRKIAEAALDTAHELAADHNVVSGDFSMRGRRREFRAAREWLDRFPKPPTIFPGNHDVPGLNQPLDRFFSPFRRYRKYLDPIEEPVLELPAVGKIVTANSSTPFGWHKDWSLGFLGPLQALHIREEFENQIGLRILGVHHPLLASEGKTRALIAPMPLVRGMIESAKVDLVLAGHFHQSRIGLFPMDQNGVYRTIVSQAPSICSTRLKGEPNGFHFLHLDPGRITIELYRWNGGKFARTSGESFEKATRGWIPASTTL